MGIRQSIKKTIPVGIKRPLKKAAMTWKKLMNREFRDYLRTGYYQEKYGDLYPERTVMVLRRMDHTSGPYSDYVTFLPYCRYAQEMGYQVVIDRKTVAPYTYQDAENFGRENAWEYFFRQPDGISVEEIFKGYGNVLRYDIDRTFGNNCFWKSPIVPEMLDKEKEMLQWKALAKRYFPLGIDLEKRVVEESERLLMGKKVLGVAIREGIARGFELGYSGNHPIQPGAEMALRDVARCLKEWEMEYVFLACETFATRTLFQKELGDRLLFIDRILRDYRELDDERYVSGEKVPYDNVSITKDYVVEMNLLAKCDSYIGGYNGGTNGVLLMKEGDFSHLFLYELGRYQH